MDPKTASPEDFQQNKVIAILSYFLFFLPLIAAKDSVYARYHANQSLILLIFYVAVKIVHSILAAIFFALFGTILTVLLNVLFWLIYVGLLALLIVGIVNAAKGKLEPLPIIGNLFTIIR